MVILIAVLLFSASRYACAATSVQAELNMAREQVPRWFPEISHDRSDGSGLIVESNNDPVQFDGW